MINCKYCGNEIDDDSEFCYFCGETVEKMDDKKMNGELEKCPFCDTILKKGRIEAQDISSIFNIHSCLCFVAEEEKDKFIRKNAVLIKKNANGYYCEKCEKFIGVFEKN